MDIKTDEAQYEVVKEILAQYRIILEALFNGIVIMQKMGQMGQKPKES